MSLGNTTLVVIWLGVGVMALVLGLVGVRPARRSAAQDGSEPDTLVG